MGLSRESVSTLYNNILYRLKYIGMPYKGCIKGPTTL